MKLLAVVQGSDAPLHSSRHKLHAQPAPRAALPEGAERQPRAVRNAEALAPLRTRAVTAVTAAISEDELEVGAQAERVRAALWREGFIGFIACVPPCDTRDS